MASPESTQREVSELQRCGSNDKTDVTTLKIQTKIQTSLSSFSRQTAALDDGSLGFTAVQEMAVRKSSGKTGQFPNSDHEKCNELGGSRAPRAPRAQEPKSWFESTPGRCEDIV